jgi:hypothetical protein
MAKPAPVKKKSPPREPLAARPVIGWREWVGLPGLGIRRIKAKIDTGARSSVIHAFAIEKPAPGRVRFGVHPLQKSQREIWCETELVEERWVTDSGGHRELRPFVRTAMLIGEREHTIELSLTARDSMRFRMLLGRTALEGRYAIDPAASYVAGKRK